MATMSIENYVEKFSRLNMASQQGRNRPHKVCLLLAVMELVEVGHIHNNRIELNGPLKERFTHFFERLSSGNDNNTPELPFFHLCSEGFWHLAYNDGIDPNNVKGYSKKAVSHAFVDEDLFQSFKSRIIANDLKAALTENLSDLPSMYSQWLLDIGKSEKTVRNYLQALQGSISSWMGEQGLIAEPLTEIKSYRTFYDLTEQAKQLETFQLRDSRGKGMYSAAINSYQRFLADLSQVDMRTDVQQILQDKTMNETEKSIMVNTRMGQGTFRNQLVNMWQGCAITGYRNTHMLVASHIKPWRDSSNQERLDKFNGLLLLANLDKAFDLGFVSFTDTGGLVISSQLEAPEVLGLQEGMTFAVEHEHKKYLDYHRGVLFRG